MSASTSIVLAATGIAAGNEWLQQQQVPWRILVAGGLLTLFEAGIDKISEPVGVGLGVIMLITVLVTPVGGAKNSPIQEVTVLLNSSKGKP